MVWGRSQASVKEILGTDKSLKQFTDQELAEFLDKNEDTPIPILACICSEVLRRQLNLQITSRQTDFQKETDQGHLTAQYK